MSLSAEHRRHLHPGKRVYVKVSLPDGALFQQWGVVSSVGQDLVRVFVTGAPLPDDGLETGAAVMVRFETEGEWHACKGLMAGKISENVIPVRPVGEIFSEELREYYRIDVFIPLAYTILATREMAEARSWLQEKRDQGKSLPEMAPFSPPPGEKLPCPPGYGPCHRVVANISGGGLKIAMGEKTADKDLIGIALHLPGRFAPVHLVAEVVHSEKTYSSTAAHQLYKTAMRFALIDESDRELVLSFIRREELDRLRETRKSAGFAPVLETGKRWKTFFGKALFVLAIMALFFHAALLAVEYKRAGHKTDFQLFIEESVRKYLNTRR